jgi:membrane associated rhomboid family serine protease
MANCISCGRPLPAFSFGQRSDVCASCRAAAVDLPTGQPAAASTPRVLAVRGKAPVTTVLVGICVAVFLAMLLSGVSFTEPTTGQLLTWGANWGPRSLGGQPWRMLTSNYLHIGFLHILFNMWCLWDLGNLTERIFDRWTYLFTYTVCGLAGSISSLWWHPLVVGAGASGAIFGLAGALIAALYLGRLPFPKKAVGHTLKSLLVFAGYNLFFGAVGSRIDNSAHVGGLVAGLLLGAVLAKKLSEPEDDRKRWSFGVFAVAAVLLFVAFSYVKKANAYVVPLEQAVTALQQNQISAAISNLERAAAERPRNGTILAMLGTAYLQEQDYAKAESTLEQAVQVDSENAGIQYDLGFARLKLGKASQAIGPLEKAAQLDPKDADVAEALAQAYLANGMPDKAKAAFAKAEELRKTAN